MLKRYARIITEPTSAHNLRTRVDRRQEPGAKLPYEIVPETQHLAVVTFETAVTSVYVYVNQPVTGDPSKITDRNNYDLFSDYQ